MLLEEIRSGAQVEGILAGQVVTVRDTRIIGPNSIEVVFQNSAGQLNTRLVMRDEEPVLRLAQAGTVWGFDANGDMFRLVSEAYRIRLAHLFDPQVAVTTSLVMPLPHQIRAVYDSMLGRQPLRYLLADDPGAGKTIMAGLLIKELMLRGDVRRCMIVCPGSLVYQWQDELRSRFQLRFEIMSGEQLESHGAGNWFAAHDLVINRLDKCARDENIQHSLRQTDWDLIICDEAHKMSATNAGGEVKFTKRYRLGQLLSGVTRHFLLMTATPHNGKDDDFHRFMALIDADRFECQSHDSAHSVDVSDIMRRMIKEKLYKFDGSPLFPERRAYTVNYSLSDDEAGLYKDVTDYVKEEFNRADRLGDDTRKGTVGFALTSLQRRLASSPEAIYQSILRRKKRLAKRLNEEKVLLKGSEATLVWDMAKLEAEDIEELEDVTAPEQAQQEDSITYAASAAQTIGELEAEIAILERLERSAEIVRRKGTDKKWEELSRLLQDTPAMVNADGTRHKLVIFTEFVDTLKYLESNIKRLLGRDEAVAVIHGSMAREVRRNTQDAFTQDKGVEVLIATDAAGEGINLQRAHLMVNYDLPWNPNRLEQRFGRIHRIGQEEVCHLWNLVSAETREGDVYTLLLSKLDRERDALGGAVFDVLGQVFQGAELRRLLVDAIRYGDQPEVKASIEQSLEQKLNTANLRELLTKHNLATDAMDVSEVMEIRADMERAQARRLQPHFIQAFFAAAFQHYGGKLNQREPRRFEIAHVPGSIRQYDRTAGQGRPLLKGYERVTFEKELISVKGKPVAELICPGHPLLDAVIGLLLLEFRPILRAGATLVNEADEGMDIRALFCFEHSITDARQNRDGSDRIVSQQMQFVYIDQQGRIGSAGPAPHLDYRAISDAEAAAVRPQLEADWLRSDLERKVLGYVAEQLATVHLADVQQRVWALVDKTERAVRQRLTSEIRYWDGRARELRLQEEAGKQPKINPLRARERANELEERLHTRTAELARQRELISKTPQVIGGALIVPIGLLRKLGTAPPADTADAASRKVIEDLAMAAVMDAETQLGNAPQNVAAENRGYDILSCCGKTGALRFIEVKGRAKGAATVTVTKNEKLTAFNSPDKFILALVEVEDGIASQPVYCRQVFDQPPLFAESSVNLDIRQLIERGAHPG